MGGVLEMVSSINRSSLGTRITNTQALLQSFFLATTAHGPVLWKACQSPQSRVPNPFSVGPRVTCRCPLPVGNSSLTVCGMVQSYDLSQSVQITSKTLSFATLHCVALAIKPRIS